MFKHVYSYGIDSPVKIQVTAKEAAAYNKVEAAFIEAYNNPKTLRRLNDQEVVLTISMSITDKDVKLYNKVQHLWVDALKSFGRPVHYTELTTDHLVRN